MKVVLSTLLVLSIFSLAAAAAEPAARVKLTLVKVIDRDDKETYQVLESEALATLQTEIKLEERLYDKAMMLAEKTWRADESTKSKSFPRSSIGHRSCTTINTYTKKEDAEKALSAMEEKLARAEESRAEAEKKREETRRKMGQNNNSSWSAKKRDTKLADAAKKGYEDQARNIFTTKLEELKKGKPDDKAEQPAGAPNQPEAAPAPAKH